MTPKEALIKAREFLSDPNHWTKGECWQGPNGEPLNVDFDDQLPSKCCAWGAVIYVDPTRKAEMHAMELLFQAVTGKEIRNDKVFTVASVFKFNDEHTHPEVLELFDKAIELA